MNLGRTILCCLILAAADGRVSAQLTDDFGTWYTVSYNKDISKSFDISADQEFRFEDNSRVLGRFFTNIGLDYKASRWLRLGINYRYIFNRRQDGSYGQKHRLAGDVVLRFQQRRFTYSYRARLQWEALGYNYEPEYGFTPSYKFRNTLKVSYKVNRMFEPFFSADFRFLLRDPDDPYHVGFDRHRLVLGTDISLNETNVIRPYFLTGQHWNLLDATRLYVIGIEYNFGSSRPLLGS